MKTIRHSLFLFCFSSLVLTGCKPEAGDLQNGLPEALKALANDDDPLLRASKQLLIVTNHDQNGFRLHTYERKGDTWSEAIPPVTAAIGVHGLAERGAKREGDGKTPSGLFRLGIAFGYGETAETKLDYRRATENDIWIDDPESELYNTWNTLPTDAKSFERMKRRDDLYKYGIVIEYNTDPVVKGNGSAIFLHVSGGPGKKTAGCVAIPERDLVRLLRWLDPKAHPVIAIGKTR